MNDGQLLSAGDGTLNYDAALPAMVGAYLPVGLKGLVAAGLLAALMSSLSSVFNSCSTLVTIDFFKERNPDASERRLVIVGQISTGVLVVIGLLWIPLMENMMSDGGLFKYLQSIQAYISPPIAAVFLFGIITPMVNHKGALSALWTGFVLGCTRLVLEFVSAPDADGNTIYTPAEGSFLEWVVNVNFLHFAIMLFAICSVVHFGVSSWKKVDTSSIRYLTMADRTENILQEASAKKDLLLTGILIIAVIIIWIIFSPFGIA